MAEKRSLLDRILRASRPEFVSHFTPSPRQVDENLWTIERQLKMPGGLLLPVVSTVIRLKSSALLLFSPPRIDPSIESWLRGLGPVSAIVAPNSFHYMFVGDYLGSFPDAKLFVAPGLSRRVPSLPPALELSNLASEIWCAEIEQTVFGPVGNFSEAIFFHRPTATLLLMDLAFHLTTFESTFARISWRLFGVPTRFGPSRMARLTLLKDKAAAGRYLQPVLAWPFRRILVAHGAVLEANAQAEFRRAFAPYLLLF
jgi:Domain of unknown function (DUF4336)